MLICCQIIGNTYGVYYVPRASFDTLLVNLYYSFMGPCIMLYEIASAVFLL